MTHTSSTIDIPTVEPISSMRATQKVALLMSFPPKAELNRRLDSPAQAPTDVFNSSSSDTFHSRIINDAKINLLEGLVHVAGHCRLDHSTITGGVQTAPANMGVEDVRRSFCTSATVIDIPSNSSFVNNIPITSSTPSVTGIDVSKTPVPLQQLIAVNLTRKVTNVRPLSLTVSDDRNLRGVGNFIFPPILKTFDAQTVDPNPNPNIIVSHRETTYSSSRSLVTLEAVPAAACLNSPSDCGQCSEIIAITPTSQVTSININSSLSQQHVTGTVPLSSAVGNQSSLTTPSSSNLPLREAPIDSPISQESRKSFNTTSPLKGGKDLHFSRKKVFSCTTCDKVYASAWGLKVHTRVHSSAPLFNCKFCKYRAVTSSGLVRHLRRHSRDRPFACSLCKKMFKSKCALKIHCDLHAGRKSHGCEICGKKFVQKSALRYHLLVHRRSEIKYSALSDNERWDEKYQFEFMTRIPEKKSSVEAELLDKQTYLCCFCSAKEISREEMAGHIYRFHKSKLMNCTLCTFFCLSRSTLDDHRSIIHNDSSSDYTCSYCGKQYSSYVHFILHYPTHFVSSSKDASCLNLRNDNAFEESLGKEQYSAFKRTVNRINYSKIQNDASQLVCKICFHVSANSRCLKLHEKTHSKGKEITCSECCEVFWKKMDYLRHSKIHDELFIRRECRACHRILKSVLRKYAHEGTCCRVSRYWRRFECPSCGEKLSTFLCFVTHIHLFHLYIPSNISLHDPAKANLSPKILNKFPFENKSEIEKANQTLNFMKNVKFDNGMLNSRKYLDRIISCILCDRSFKTVDHFSHHWREKCSLNAEVLQCAHLKRTIVFICSWCGGTFASFELMMKHEMQSHLGQEKTVFSCRLCGKMFLNRDHCFSHFRTCGLSDEEFCTEMNVFLDVFDFCNYTSLRNVQRTFKGSVFTMYDCNEIRGGKLEVEMFFNGEIVSYLTLNSEMNYNNIFNLCSKNSIVRFRKRDKKWKLSK